MADTRRAALYLVPPPAIRLSSARPASPSAARGSRVRAQLRPLLRATSRAVLRLADFTQRLGI